MMIADQVLARGIRKYLLGVVFFCIFGAVQFQNLIFAQGSLGGNGNDQIIQCGDGSYGTISQCYQKKGVDVGGTADGANNFAKTVSNSEKNANCMKTYSEAYCECKIFLQGIYLNTEVPFVGTGQKKRCLVMDTAANAPTTVLQSLTKIMMTFVMIGGFGMIVWAGMLMASSGSDETRFKQGKDILIGVVIAFALLGSLGVILRLINPNFFT